MLVIGRREATFSVRLLLPPLAMFAAWSSWAITAASPEAWAAALAWPFTRKADWWLAAAIVGLGLPFAPFALMATSRPVRESWGEAERKLMTGWVQVAIACLVAGTIVPGLAQAARVPAGRGADGRGDGPGGSLDRHPLHIGPPALLRPHDRDPGRLARDHALRGLRGPGPPVLPCRSGIATLLIGIPVLALGWTAVETSRARRGLVALILLTFCLKMLHWGYYVPEWNYRHGQGPWGRAIGQWLMPNWTVYTFLEWPADLALAIGRPVGKLRSEVHLEYEGGLAAKHVLLTEPEFDHWPDRAPRIRKVATFLDKEGRRRSWRAHDGILLTPSGRILPQQGAPGSESE